MQHNPIERTKRELSAREKLGPSESHRLWRLESGALRIDTPGQDALLSFVRLVLPGDVFGVEEMLGIEDRFVVTALKDSRLLPITITDAGVMTQVLSESVSTGYRRSREMVAFRSGPADARIKCLLQVIAGTESGNNAATTECIIPSLNDIASIINAAPETVSRSLASLRQINFLQDCSPNPSKYSRLGYRSHRVQVSALQNAAA
jgi:CRP-like cAMP-binding protein